MYSRIANNPIDSTTLDILTRKRDTHTLTDGDKTKHFDFMIELSRSLLDRNETLQSTIIRLDAKILQLKSNGGHDEE